MGIENTKRWHWIVVSLAVGPLLAFMNGQAEPGAGLRSMSGSEFEREITLKEVPGGSPNLKNVVVHPAIAGAYDKPVHVVTMDRAVYDQKDKGWRYQPYALQAEVPYVTYPPGGRRGKTAPAAAAVSPDRTILTALTDLAAKNPATVKYKYAWWEEPKWSYGLWTAGSLVAIGGVWPTVLSLLIGAGLGPKPKEEEYDLDRFQSSASGEEEAAKPAPKAMSEEDREKLHAQLDHLEQNVGTAAVMTAGPNPLAPPTNAGPAPIRQLNGGPVELQAAAEKEEDDKEYKGEFYPVARVAQPKAE